MILLTTLIVWGSIMTNNSILSRRTASVCSSRQTCRQTVRSYIALIYYQRIAEVAQRETEPHGTVVDQILGHISDLYIEKALTERLIGSVNIKDICPIQPSTPLLSNHFGNKWRIVNDVASKTRHSATTPEEVSRKFGVDIDTVKETLRVTTQRGIRHAAHPLHRRYRVDNMQYNRKCLNSQWYTDP